jgi:hypothetical protein
VKYFLYAVGLREDIASSDTARAVLEKYVSQGIIAPDIELGTITGDFNIRDTWTFYAEPRGLRFDALSKELGCIILPYYDYANTQLGDNISKSAVYALARLGVNAYEFRHLILGQVIPPSFLWLNLSFSETSLIVNIQAKDYAVSCKLPVESVIFGNTAPSFEVVDKWTNGNAEVSLEIASKLSSLLSSLRDFGEYKNGIAGIGKNDGSACQLL